MVLLEKLKLYFTRHEMVSLSFILFCSAIMGIMEMLTVVSITPFFLVISKPEVVETNVYLAQFASWIGIYDPKQLLIVLGVGVLGFLLMTNLFSLFTHHKIAKFGYTYGCTISSRLVNIYLNQPYRFHLDRHTAGLCKNSIDEVNRFVNGFLLNGLNCVAKVAVIIAQICVLFIVDFKLACYIILFLTLFYFIAFSKIRKQLNVVGSQVSIAYESRYQAAREALGAIKEIKLLGRSEYFMNWFKRHAGGFAKSEALNYMAPFVSRYLLDTIAFGGMIVISLYFIFTRGVVNDVLPVLGIYALAGYRLIPAAQQLFQGGTLAGYHFSAAQIIDSELTLEKNIIKVDKASQQALSFERAIELRNIDFSYGDKPILKQVNLKIEKSTTIGIVGETGSGKTTLIDIILGLLNPSQGGLYVDGQQIDSQSHDIWQKKIGYVPQNIFLIDDTIEKNIALGISESKLNVEHVTQASKMARLHEFIVSGLPLGYQTKIGEGGVRLSGGQRQRIGIARALYHDPEILVFDEATSSLDSKTEKQIMDSMAILNHKKTIIMVAHRLNTVKDCDIIFVMDKGQVVGMGTYDTLIESNATFKRIAQVA